MSSEKEMNWEKTAREAVNAQCAGEAPSPEKAGALICAQIAKASRQKGDARAHIVAVCHGAMTGLALNHADLPAAAVETLKGLANISLMSRSDPSDIMTWVLEGFAEATTVAGFTARVEIQHRIDGEFHGVGEVFDKLCEEVKKRGPGAP